MKRLIASSANYKDFKRCIFDGKGIFYDNIMEVKHSLYFSPNYPKIDGGAAGDSGTLLTAQTITSDSVSTTTTTHITKVKQSRGIPGRGRYNVNRILSELFLGSYTHFKVIHRQCQWNKHADI